MLKARIFTNHPGNADSLAEALKQQGYLVEVLRPEQAPGPSADLEIVLETCAGDDVIRRAAELAQEFDADVAVAPGTLASAVDEVQAFLNSAAEPSQATPLSEIEFQLVSAPPQDPAEAHKGAALPAMEHAERESHTIERETAEPGVVARAVPRVVVTLAAWATSAQEVLFSARAQAREYREHAMRRFALVRLKREERLLELTHHRIEAQEQASRLATARKNAAAYLLQLERESGGAIRSTNRGLSEQPATEAAVRPWRVLFEGLIERVRPVRWDAVLAGLASAGALFAVGLAVASFNSKPNLTKANEPPAAASTPVSAKTAPATTATTTTSPAPPANQSAQRRSRKPSPAQHTCRANRCRPDASDDREGGNDVVVRHLVSPSPTPKQQAQRWKHFSDMDH
jgi:hypothetical protein